MGIRDIYRGLRRKITGETDLQELLKNNNVKMEKTKAYDADDHDGKVAWSYRFTFDNQARKQNFLKAVGSYPPQEWDEYIDWWDDISNMNGEICVEARCLVPPEKTGRVRHKFEHFVTRDLILKD